MIFIRILFWLTFIPIVIILALLASSFLCYMKIFYNIESRNGRIYTQPPSINQSRKPWIIEWLEDNKKPYKDLDVGLTNEECTICLGEFNDGDIFNDVNLSVLLLCGE